MKTRTVRIYDPATGAERQVAVRVTDALTSGLPDGVLFEDAAYLLSDAVTELNARLARQDALLAALIDEKSGHFVGCRGHDAWCKTPKLCAALREYRNTPIDSANEKT